MSKPTKIPARRPRGFTALELLGVLMVVSLLAAAVAPNLIGLARMQKIRREREVVQALGSALRAGIIRARQLPNDDTRTAPADPAADWPGLAALGGGGGLEEIRVNSAGAPRRLFLARPAAWRGAGFNRVTGDGTAGGWLPGAENGLRLILLGAGDRRLPLPEALSEEDFDWLWDRFVPAAGDAESADLAAHGFAEAWRGRAFDLAVARVDLRDLVVPVTLEARRRLTVASPGAALEFSGRPGETPSFAVSVRGAGGVVFAHEAPADTTVAFTLRLRLVHPGELDRAVSEDPDGKVTVAVAASSGGSAFAELDVGSSERPSYVLAENDTGAGPASHPLLEEQTDLRLLRGQEIGLTGHPDDGVRIARAFVVEPPFRHLYFDGLRWSNR